MSGSPNDYCGAKGTIAIRLAVSTVVNNTLSALNISLDPISCDSQRIVLLEAFESVPIISQPIYHSQYDILLVRRKPESTVPDLQQMMMIAD